VSSEEVGGDVHLTVPPAQVLTCAFRHRVLSYMIFINIPDLGTDMFVSAHVFERARRSTVTPNNASCLSDNGR
jgi:hypothetical protein